MPDKNLPLVFSATSTIKDIPENDWDSLFGKDIPEGFGYHKTLEESGIKEFRLGYLLGKRGGKLVAVLPFFINDFSFSTIIQGPLQKLILSLQKVFRRFLKMKMLFVGFPTTEELYIGLSDTENTDEIFDGALKKFREMTKNEKISIILFYNLSEKHRSLAAYLEKNGFARMEDYPNTKIEIRAGSLKEYVDSLGKNTRKDLRRKLNRSSNMPPLTTEIVDDIGGLRDRIYGLYLNNFSASGVHFETLTPDFFQDICRNMRGTAKFFITRERDRVVAFNLCLVKGQTCIDKFIGFDKDISHTYHLYYRTFLHNIEWCIKNGLRYYQMGVTDYDPKVRLGAELVPLSVYFRLSWPVANLFSRFVAGLIKPANFDPALKKFLKRKAGVVPSEGRGAV